MGSIRLANTGGKGMQAAKKGAFNVIYGLLGQIITICLGIVIPRLVLVSYGSEVNGLLNSVNQIFVYFSLFEAGVGVASLQALYAPVAQEDRGRINGIIAATHRFYCKAGVLYALAVTGLAFVYPFVVKTEISYWVIVGVILFGGLGNCLNFLYQGKYKILMQAEGYTYISTNITTIINVLINVAKTAVLLMGYNVLVVQMVYFAINICQMLIYYAYVRKHYQWIDLKAEPDNRAIEQKGATLIHQIAGMIFSNTDVLLLTLITQNLKIVSIYTMYNTIVTMVTTMIQQVSAGFDFRLGQIYNTDRKQYYVLHHVFEIIYMLLVFSAMTVVYLFILPFMRLYTAGIQDINYISKWYPICFVMVPMLTYGRTAASNVINYAGHFRKTQWRAVAESVINIVVSVFGIYKWGIYGALLGTIIASLYRTNDMIFYVYKHLIPGNPLTTYKRWISCFGVFALVVAWINPDNPAFSSYPKILFFGCIYGVVFAAIYTLVQMILNPGETKVAGAIIRDCVNKWKGRN